MAELLDVLVIGFGAVGVVYSYILEQSGRCRVTAIARSAYESMNEHGVRLESAKFGHIPAFRPHRLVRAAEDACDRNYAFIICTFKCLPDIQPTPAVLAPFLRNRDDGSQNPTTVVLIQNGIGIEQPIAVAFPHVHIISCCAWIGTNLIPGNKTPDKSTGYTVEHGQLEKLVFGLYEGEGGVPLHGDTRDRSHVANVFVEGLLGEDGAPLTGSARQLKRQIGKGRVQLFSDCLTVGGSTVETVDDIQPARWAKNLWNVGWSSVCTLSRSTVGDCIAPEVISFTLPIIRRAMFEALYVARAMDYGEDVLPAKSIDSAIELTTKNYAPAKVTSASEQVKEGQAIAEEDEEEMDKSTDTSAEPTRVVLNRNFKPSMLLDLENGRPMELEPILGSILDRARQKALETPRLDVIYAILKVQQEVASKNYLAKLPKEQGGHSLNWSIRKPSVGGFGSEASREEWKRQLNERTQVDHETQEGHPRRVSKVNGRPVS